MSEFKGTPGLWFVSECWDVESKVTGNMIAAVAGFEQSDEDRANARLIAAAPELLEALQACEKILSEIPLTVDLVEDLLFARETITKALGQ